MVRKRWMARLARWHIWLGWMIGVPLILWTLSGVAMVARPIEEVRGEHLRIKTAAQPLPGRGQVTEVRTFVERGRPVTLVTRVDGSQARYDAAGRPLPQVDAAQAREIVIGAIHGGDGIHSMIAYPASAPPLDLRRPIASWQATLGDGTHVYVNRDTGAIEAVRTRWWRIYDFMWGLHIMDLRTREDGHNPFVIGFGLLSLTSILLGTVLLFRRRRARAAA